MKLNNYSKLIVKQHFEGLELLGIETRNKFAILDPNEKKIGFAAEQQKGFLGLVLRQFLGHWRTFDIHFFNEKKEKFMTAHHPFRFIFQRFEIFDTNNNFLGALQQRFSILTKVFDVLDKNGHVILEMRSPLWKFWTFPFYSNNREVARIEKKWSGLLVEAMTDKDTFMIHFTDANMSQEQRSIILASSIFVDLQYFEGKAGN